MLYFIKKNKKDGCDGNSYRMVMMIAISTIVIEIEMSIILIVVVKISNNNGDEASDNGSKYLTLW